MPVIERNSRSLDATRVIARDLALVLRPGDVLRLDGEMGAGKTTFVRFLAAAMGIDESQVSSPTFVIVNEYGGADGRPDLVHLDCYRLGEADELDALGWDRFVPDHGRGDEIVAIEWAERVEARLPGHTVRVVITPTGETERHFAFEIPDDWASRAGIDGLHARADTTCPVTGEAVPGDSPTWPFASERARLADLYKWMSGGHVISRPAELRDLDEE